MMLDIVNTALLTGVVVTCIAALLSRDMLKSVIYLAGMSILLSLEFYMLHAPDVAIAEAAVGAGLTTAIYVAAIRKTERFEDGGKDS
jgi:energy-converting hydrogenase B subunit D